jgi:preprotein translocase subunit SecG
MNKHQIIVVSVIAAIVTIAIILGILLRPEDGGGG